MNYEQQIIKFLESDALCMKALATVNRLDLPDWLIAAGFVRNLIWNRIFGADVAINDIDVIYFCGKDISEERDKKIEKYLFELHPNLPWSVKNQARMHTRNKDRPYLNTLDAMSFWPEKQTSIGVKLDSSENVVINHCFDLAFQFNGKIDHNPKRTIDAFRSRVISKGWLEIWPSLEVKT